jgi:hypothetical protein
MSEALAKPSKGIEVDYPPFFPVARMPDDILHLIMEHYVEARLDELEDHAEKGPYWRKATQWPVLPLLTSCKAICDALVPKLYRYTLLLDDQIVNRFLSEPAVASFQHVRILDIHKMEYNYNSRIAPQIMRIHQKPFEFPLDEQCVNMDSPTAEAATSRIDTLRLREKAFQNPLGLLAW